MKRNLMAIILALCLIGTSLAGAEGLLPSLTDTIGKPMPSLGEALGRYPDDEISNADGSNTEVFQGVTETDFNTFSVYLSEQGATLADYQAAGTSFSASIQVEGKTISFTYDTQALKATVTYPKGTYDEWLDYANAQFASAVQLLNTGKTDDALAVLFSIPGYSGFKPVAEYFEANPELATAAREAEYFEANPELATAAREARLAPYKSVGGIVTFGTYPQTASGSDKTPIEWLVLDYDAASNRALIISRYGLDAKPYNTKFIDITWEKCTLRTWLNNDFLNAAFTAQEQKGIVLTTVDNSKSQGSSRWDTNGGNNTQDKIFLLSYAEANKYFGVAWEDGNNMKSRVTPTAYALKAGAWTNDSKTTADGAKAGWWWLRSPGDFQSDAASVSSAGSLSDNIVPNFRGYVRPALWLNLESGIF